MKILIIYRNNYAKYLEIFNVDDFFQIFVTSRSTKIFTQEKITQDQGHSIEAENLKSSFNLLLNRRK